MLLCKTPSSGLLPSSLSFSPSQALSVRLPARSRHPRLLLASAVLFFFLCFFIIFFLLSLSLCVSSIRLSQFIFESRRVPGCRRHSLFVSSPSFVVCAALPIPPAISSPLFVHTRSQHLLPSGPGEVGLRIAQVRLRRSLESPPRKTKELARWLYPANQSTPYPGTSFQMS